MSEKVVALRAKASNDYVVELTVRQIFYVKGAKDKGSALNLAIAELPMGLSDALCDFDVRKPEPEHLETEEDAADWVIRV